MKLMHEGWPALLASIANGGPIRLAAVALLLAVTVTLTVIGVVRQQGRCSLWLLYLAGITFCSGIVSGAANGLHFWARMCAGEAVQANPMFECLSGLLSYTTVALTALVGSLITKIPNHTSEPIVAKRAEGSR